MDQRYTVDDLIDLAPPPEWRVDAGSPDDWDRVELDLGTSLPEDYKLIINVYGTGEFNDLFVLFNPFSSAEHKNLLWQAGMPHPVPDEEKPSWHYPAGSILDHYQGLKGKISDRWFPFPFFPEPGGLLPLGADTNGGEVFWLTEGPPSNWPLILISHGLEPIERHDLPLVDFLTLWLSGRLPDCFDGAGMDFVNRTDPVFENFWKAPAS